MQCHTCQRRCIIPAGGVGWCLTRENEAGVLHSLTYGEVSSLSINPIEKKPVFHFLPGSQWLSVGSWGCNFRCPGCQNWEIAHWKGRVLERSNRIGADELVRMALNYGCDGVSWTFNEPTLWLEYTLDAAKLAKRQNLYTNYVTNGFMTEEALELLSPYLDVYRVDLKAFSSETYQKIAHVSDFGGILTLAEKAKRYGIHVEVVTNIIPGFNDDDGQLRGIATWVKECLGDETPWHVTRFHPYLKLSHLTPTKVSVLERAREIGISCGLKFVYLGNVPGHAGENTYCPDCGALLIRRQIFDVIINDVKDGCCLYCGRSIAGRFYTR